MFLHYDTIDNANIKFNLKSDLTYVDTSCNFMIRRFQYYETILGAYINLFDKADKVDTS